MEHKLMNPIEQFFLKVFNNIQKSEIITNHLNI